MKKKQYVKKTLFLTAALITAIILFTPYKEADAKEVIRITPESGEVSDVQAALSQAAEDEGNYYIINVPKGTYKLYRQLVVYSNTTLNLKGVTYKRQSSTKQMITLGDNSQGGYGAGSNIVIQGGVFHGGTEPGASDLCHFSHVNNVTFKGCTFKYMPSRKVKTGEKNTHMIEFSGSKNVTFTNCKFLNNNNGLFNNEAIQIESTYNEKKLVASMPDLGVLDGTQCKNITITKCYFKGFNYGCGSNHLSKKDQFTNMKFTKNTFVNARKYAICLYGYKNVTISGNKLKNCGSLYQNQYSTGIKVK